MRGAWSAAHGLSGIGPTAPSACQGIAAVGGYVAKRVHGLKGHYVFGDYSRQFANALGRLWVLRDGQVEALPDPGVAVFGFGQDKHGDLFVLGNETGLLSGDTGVVLKITEGDD